MSIPEGFHTVTPYLLIEQAAQAIDFYKRAFNAEQMLLMEHGGRIEHAELMVGNSPIMLATSTATNPANRIHMMLYVPDVDATIAQAVDAGAEVIAQATDKSDEGERRGGILDPFGITWWIGTQIRVVSRTQMQQAHDNQADSQP